MFMVPFAIEDRISLLLFVQIVEVNLAKAQTIQRIASPRAPETLSMCYGSLACSAGINKSLLQSATKRSEQKQP